MNLVFNKKLYLVDGSNKENIEGKRIMIIKCQRLNPNTNVTGLKLVSQSTEPDSKNNKPITNKSK